MNNPDYKTPLFVKCVISDDPKEFTVGMIYECFSISKAGSAKVIDNEREENYLLLGQYRYTRECEQ